MNRCLICGKEAERTYHPKCANGVFQSTTIPEFNYTQQELNELAKSVIMQKISVPGVQPKISLHLEKSAENGEKRLTLVGMEGDYILKPPSIQWPHLPEAEHFTMLFARMCKIKTADFALIPLKTGELAYITRRMDRTTNTSLHMEDFCQLTNKLTSQKYRGSMEQIGKALRSFSNTPGLDAVRLYELIIFCFLTGNSDMHLKNFSLLRYNNGNYELAPAYDLIPANVILPGDKEELALSMNGKKNNLKKIDFVTFATKLELTKMQQEKTWGKILSNAEKHFADALRRSFLPLALKEKIHALFQLRLARFSA